MTSNIQQHPGNEALERYSLGHLPEVEVERIEEHLFVCERCQNELLAVETYIRDLKEVCKDLDKPVETKAGLLSRWWAAIPMPALAGAAAMVLLVAAIPLFHQSSTTTGAPVGVELAAMRGANDSAIASAAAGRPLQLRINAQQLPPASSYRAEIVDAVGKTVWTGNPVVDGNRLLVNVSQSLRSGAYWVRLYDKEPDPIREFGLTIK